MGALLRSFMKSRTFPIDIGRLGDVSATRRIHVAVHGCGIPRGGDRMPGALPPDGLGAEGCPERGKTPIVSKPEVLKRALIVATSTDPHKKPTRYRRVMRGA
jgi:hypothetical protein